MGLPVVPLHWDLLDSVSLFRIGASAHNCHHPLGSSASLSYSFIRHLFCKTHVSDKRTGIRHRRWISLLPSFSLGDSEKETKEAFIVVILTFVRSWHLTKLTDHGGFIFDLIQLILPNYLANKAVTTQHVISNNCKFEPLSSPTSAIPEDHAPLYQLQMGRYVQLRSWVDP